MAVEDVPEESGDGTYEREVGDCTCTWWWAVNESRWIRAITLSDCPDHAGTINAEVD